MFVLTFIGLLLVVDSRCFGQRSLVRTAWEAVELAAPHREARLHIRLDFHRIAPCPGIFLPCSLLLAGEFRLLGKPPN